jgi:hypothetical protein
MKDFSVFRIEDSCEELHQSATLHEDAAGRAYRIVLSILMMSQVLAWLFYFSRISGNIF